MLFRPSVRYISSLWCSHVRDSGVCTGGAHRRSARHRGQQVIHQTNSQRADRAGVWWSHRLQELKWSYCTWIVFVTWPVSALERKALLYVSVMNVSVHVWTYCMSAMQLLQQSIVCAFGETTLLIDKSQHAQFLKGRQTEEQRVEHTTVVVNVIRKRRRNTFTCTYVQKLTKTTAIFRTCF